MNYYHSRYDVLHGTSYSEVMHLARKEYATVKKLTKRQPYVRSSYFAKDKVFLALFWEHLAQKHRADRKYRLQYYTCALDLLRHSTLTPATLFSEADKNTMLHRFYGKTKQGLAFCVQVKQDKRTGRKDFISVFPEADRRKLRNK